MMVAKAFPQIEDRPEKILPRHLERLAAVYIRQSSMQQVHRNQESTKIQYSLTGLARQLGWVEDRILTIDDDLGISGTSAVGREGFQRLLAEVALDHVGIILGVEMSRLARSNKDWHQLLELCARFGTLIADLDGLYDPSRYNDRLLLGLKGTMSEAELHILRQRLLQGKLQKARRGELGKPVPTGYLRTASGEVTLDPDEEVQAAVRMIFDAFERIGTIHGVLRELVRLNVQIGVRHRTGRDLGQLAWHRPHRGMLYNVLHNAIFAGAYVYGRRGTDPRRQQPGRRASGRTPLLPPEQWQACLRDRLPAYISWEQYERNLAKLKANRKAPWSNMPRNGSALLSSLVVCGRCQYRMSVQYSTRNGRAYPRYVCNHAALAHGEPVCSGLSGPSLDHAVSELALAALAPAALEVSMKVSEELEREREKAERLWQQRLQRVRYEAERAERQYHAVEPENRLVARTLERAWEDKLQVERSLREEYERRQRHEKRCLTQEERATIRMLATDLPTLWNASTTTTTDRKAVLRLLIERVVVVVAPDSESVDLVVRWAGGHETTTRIRRPVGKLTQLNNHEQLLARIRELRRAGRTSDEIANKLNADGWVTPTQRNTFNGRLVRAMLYRYGSVPRGPRRPTIDDPNARTIAQLAAELQMPAVTLYGWMRRGWLKTRRVNGQRIAIVNRRDADRLRRLRAENPRPRRRASATNEV